MQPPPTARYVRDETPSAAWYLVPLLFGIVGGLIGYVGTKDRDADMSINLLVIGMIWSVVAFLISWGWITSFLR